LLFLLNQSVPVSQETPNNIHDPNTPTLYQTAGALDDTQAGKIPQDSTLDDLSILGFDMGNPLESGNRTPSPGHSSGSSASSPPPTPSSPKKPPKRDRSPSSRSPTRKGRKM